MAVTAKKLGGLLGEFLMSRYFDARSALMRIQSNPIHPIHPIFGGDNQKNSTNRVNRVPSKVDKTEERTVIVECENYFIEGSEVSATNYSSHGNVVLLNARRRKTGGK